MRDLDRGTDLRRLMLYVVAGAVCLSLAHGAFAADDTTTAAAFRVLDAIDDNYKPFAKTWYSAIKGYAKQLFWLLALVDFSWTTVQWALEKNEIGEIVVGMTRKILSYGFFFSLLLFSDTWIPAIIDSFRQIGQEVGHTTATPDGVFRKGYDVALGMFRLLDTLNLVESVVVGLPVVFMALVIAAAFLIVAGQLLVILIESYLIIGAGVILLGFGGSRWTTDFATKYLQHAVGTGLKLMLIYLLIGAGQTLVNDMVIDSNHLIASTLAMEGTALIYAYLAINVPKLAGAMMSGSPALTAGDAMGAALTLGATMAGGAALAGAGMQAAGGFGGNAAAGGTGLAKALGAGVSSGLDMGKSGMELATHAAGEVAQHGLGLGASAIGSAVNGAKTAFAEMVDNSTGGKIASSIEATRGGDMSGASVPPPAAGSDAGTGTAPIASGAGNSGASAVPAPATSPATSGTAPAAGTRSVIPPPVVGATTTAGNASTASITGPASSSPEPMRYAPLSHRIQDLQGYVPQDMAQVTVPQISAEHAKD